MRWRFPPESCVVAARLAVDYLTARGWHAVPIAVEAVTGGPGWYEERADQLAAFLADPAAHPDAFDNWGGRHVVCVARKGPDALFVDLAIDQTSRPGCPVAPLVATVTVDQAEAFVAGRAGLVFRAGDVTHAYRVNPYPWFRRDGEWWYDGWQAERAMILAAVRV